VPAHTRPFDEVKAQVREQVVAQRAAELARKDGEARLAAWKAAPASASLPAPVTLSRQEMAGQPRPVVEAALRADAAKLPALVGVDLGTEGYAIVKVDKVLSRQAPTPQQAQQELAQYANAWANAEAQAYYELLKDRFKAQINVPKPAGTPAQ
jgi:peptidyl-prolyl cis-trans isomerase D